MLRPFQPTLLVGTCAGLPVPAGTGRVGYGSGLVWYGSGTGIPGFTHKEHDFGAKTFLFLHVF